MASGVSDSIGTCDVEFSDVLFRSSHTNVRKLHRQLGIRLDYDEVEKLFFRRLDDPSLIFRAASRPTSTTRRPIRSAASRERSTNIARA